jgi:hypothetical protein
MTQSEYASNIKSAIDSITSQLINKDKYEIDVIVFNERAVKMYGTNKAKIYNAKISLDHKMIYKKANKKIRKIIQLSDKELNDIHTKRKSKILQSVCNQYQVKQSTVTRLL